MPPLLLDGRHRLTGVTTLLRQIHRAARTITLLAATGYMLSGCLPAASEPPGVTPLEGQWDVSGQSSSGAGGAFQGGLTVRSTSGTGYTGSYDIVETSSQGLQRRMSGPVGGRMASTTATEFDVSLGGTIRRHVATQIADTLRGNWFDVATSGAVEASGSFRAIRKR